MARMKLPPRTSLLPRALAALLCVTCATACTQPRTPDPIGPTQLSVHPQEYSRLFEAACLVLEDMGFDVARRDYRFGRIASAPLNSPVVFEFWKPTHDRAFGSAMHSTINDQRRVARLFFEPADTDHRPTARQSAGMAMPGLVAPDPQPQTPDPDPPPHYTLRVEVMIERLQQPARYMTHSAHRPAALLADIPAEVAAIGVHGPYWQPITRDDALAADILERTVRRSLELARPDTPVPALPVEAL